MADGSQLALRNTDEEATTAVTMFERLALDPSVNVEKLERLIEMQERIMRHNAKSAFDGAYSLMSGHIPQVDERGRVVVKGTLRSTYARLEDIHEAVKPVLQQFGFAIRHRTEWPADRPNIIRIVGILSHERGHSEESCFEAPMDRSEYRSDIQSMGSTVSYGRRYTTLDLLNIATRGMDDDGHKSGRPEPPDGYEDWIFELRAQSVKGVKALEDAWAKAKSDFKNFAVKHDKVSIDGIKADARAVAK